MISPWWSTHMSQTDRRTSRHNTSLVTHYRLGVLDNPRVMLKIYRLYSFTTDFDSADPICSSMHNVCHTWTQLNDLALHEFSLLRAPAWCLGGHGFNSCWGLKFYFLCSMCSCHVDQLTFHFLLPSLKSTIIIHLPIQWDPAIMKSHGTKKMFVIAGSSL